MYKHGVLAMKAWPFHKGHEHLIQTAVDQCEKVTVMVVWGEGQTPGGPTRAAWVQKTFPSVDVKCVADIFVDDNNPKDSEMWAIYTRDIITDDFDVVFSSEPYGKWWADLMGVKSVIVDAHRTFAPISGTKIRDDPYYYWQYINKEARLHYLKRVLIVGSESTGKTTLCQTLSGRYGTLYVPEYGRIYSERFEHIEEMPEAQRRVIFGNIVNRQPELEREIEREARLVCFYDTDLITTGLFYEQWQPERIGDRLHKTILQAAKENDRYDLVLISNDDVPWVQDGQREQTDETRREVTQRLLNLYGARAVLLTETWEHREALAIDAVNGLFNGTEASLPVSRFDYAP